MVLVDIDAHGQRTLPAEARAALHLAGQAKLACEVVDGGILLRPVTQSVDVYTLEQQESVRRGLADIKAGRTYRLSEEDLLALLARAEEAERNGRVFQPSSDELRTMEAKTLAAEQ